MDLALQPLSAAADRLNVSVDTVRRWCRTGVLESKQLGETWLVPDDAVPMPQAQTAASLPRPLDFERALRNVRTVDLVEEWVPDILRHEDQLLDSRSLLEEARSRYAANSWDAATEVAIPKTPFFTRPAQLISLRDRIAYHAAVATFAQLVDDSLPEQVYSARLNDPAGDEFTRKGVAQWGRWRSRVRSHLDQQDSWLIRSDLTAYFDCIRHDFLLQDVASIGADPGVQARVRGHLSAGLALRAKGVAQGPDASRILGNLFLLPVDTVMLAEGFRYYRYMDDVRVIRTARTRPLGRCVSSRLSVDFAALLQVPLRPSSYTDNALETPTPMRLVKALVTFSSPDSMHLPVAP